MTPMGEGNFDIQYPSWDDPDLISSGGMVRGALWLLCEVGEGNTFTKEQLRQAFPGIAQIDRRVRDLRAFGWVIHSSSEDASLRPEEQRFVKPGVPVWKSEERRKVAAKTISARERQAAFAADSYQCVACGISGGEPYPDSSHETAVLSVTRQPVHSPDGLHTAGLVTLCRRCLAGARELANGDARDVLRRVSDLDDEERRQLLEWLRVGRRTPRPLDQAWVAYMRLPVNIRKEVRRTLGHN
jgi:5-methylcytosine-specific restriction endonuclease McrA